MGKWNVVEKECTESQSEPSYGDLQHELMATLRGVQTLPEKPIEAVNEFLGICERQLQMERPYRKGNAWQWPYRDRIMSCANVFKNMKPSEQEIIKSIAEEKIRWRGESLKMFVLIRGEFQRMRKMGVQQYRKQALNDLEKLKVGM